MHERPTQSICSSVSPSAELKLKVFEILGLVVSRYLNALELASFPSFFAMNFPNVGGKLIQQIKQLHFERIWKSFALHKNQDVCMFAVQPSVMSLGYQILKDPDDVQLIC